MKSLFFAALLLAAAPAALADPFTQDELTWLDTMAFAAHLTDYSGIFIYQYGNHVETTRITHVSDASGEHGRLESLDGTRREIIRNNDEVWCYLGDGKVRMERKHGGGREFPALLPDPDARANIAENYVIRQAGEARVAGFHAHAILFQPKDNQRYGHRMWADSESGLLLKAEVIDERGDTVEQYAFTQLTVGGDIDRSWIAQAPDAAAHNSTARHVSVKPGAAPVPQQQGAAQPGVSGQSAASGVPAGSGWEVDGLPPGFRKITEIRRTMHKRAAPAIQMVYSDGLAGISVFIEQDDHDEDDGHTGLTSRGAIQVYSMPVGDHLVTVVGEVPPQTVMQVANSVRHAGE